jgi:hypothetical protein
LLRRHGEIGIEDDENVAASDVKTGEDRVALAATRSISSQVPSFECPSTKMISSRSTKDGMRLTAASILPRSLRAGMTTLADLTSAGRRSERQTVKCRRQNRRMSGSGAKKRFTSRPNPKSRSGTRTRVSFLTASKSPSTVSARTSAGASTFCGGCGIFRPVASASFSAGYHKCEK